MLTTESITRHNEARQYDPVTPATSVLDAAEAYIERGYNPTPLKPGIKEPVIKNWTATAIKTAKDVERYFGPNDGIGLVLGKMSNGLVCLDLDSAESLALASLFLPKTEMIEGRPSSPASHWYYIADPVPQPAKFRIPTLARPIVELLADGQQVVVPPTLYGGGERREWTKTGEPGRVNGGDLVAATERLAAAVTILTIWPKGNTTGIRHDAVMALAGGLIRAGWTQEEIEAYVVVLCRESGDDEIEDRLAAIASTIKRFDDGEKTTGWPKLAELLEAPSVLSHALRWLGVTDIDLDDPRPAIRVDGAGLDRITNAAWTAILDTIDAGLAGESADVPAPALFVNGGVPVRIEYNRNTERQIIRPLTVDRLRYHAAEMIRWIRTNAKGITHPVEPPVSVIRNLLATPQPELPVLDRISSAPVFASTGELVTEPGYNRAARVYVDIPSSLIVPEVPKKPSRADLDRAKALIDELLIDFPLTSEADRANAIALMLLPFGRDFIKGKTPLHLIEAPTAGTGKGLLMQVLTGVFTGAAGTATITESTDANEWKKTITSKLMEGAAYIAIDNVSQRLDNPHLLSALTASIWSDRILATNLTFETDPRCVWIATGNNVEMNDEQARRTVLIQLDSGVERPFQRTGFKHRLPDWAIEHRGELIAACLTIWQAWLAAGRPKGKGTLGSFEEWHEVMGGVLNNAGIPGLLGNADELYGTKSTEENAWFALVDLWAQHHGGDEVKAGLIYTLMETQGVEGIPLKGHTDQGRATSFGMVLGKQVRRIYGNYRIAFGGPGRSKARMYRLEQLDPSKPWPERVQPVKAVEAAGFFPNLGVSPNNPFKRNGATSE